MASIRLEAQAPPPRGPCPILDPRLGTRRSTKCYLDAASRGNPDARAAATANLNFLALDLHIAPGDAFAAARLARDSDPLGPRRHRLDPRPLRRTHRPQAPHPPRDRPRARGPRRRRGDPGETRAPAQLVPGDRATFYVPRSDDNPRRGRRLMYMRDLACCANGMAFSSTPSDLVRFALATNPGSVNGALAGGKVMSLMTGRDSGIVIAVTSNMAHANTSSLALRVGDAFAEQTG